MVIGIDANEANVTARVGVSVYTFNLLHEFKKKASSSLKFRIFLRQAPLIDFPSETNNFKYEVIKGNILWSQIFMPLRLFSKKDVDVFFAPAHYAPRFSSVPTVVTIHDLSYFYYPADFLKGDLFKLKNWTKYSVRKAAKVITVSKTTKKDLLSFYNVPEEKVEVVYNGYEKILKSKARKLKFTKLQKKPYFLYVGTLQPRKNIPLLLQAFEKYKSNAPDFELIIAGKKGWLYEKIFDQVSELGLNDSVFFTDYIPDSQLAYLYENAFALILPSLYEGFGIPILEAMNYDCPVITSFSSSLPEIGGDACLYFDPQNVDDLLEKMLLLQGDNNLRQELITKGRRRIKFFSWKACADKTLEIIKSVCQ